MFFHRVSGLPVASEIALPGLVETPATGMVAVTIRYGLVPETLDRASAAGPTWQIAGERLLLRLPGIGRFLVADGKEIVVALDPAADDADLPIFVLGTALGILLQQRQQIVLQASAVLVNGRAVLFCGASGSGKSTLAAALAARGYPLVADDICTITFAADGSPCVHAEGRLPSLWQAAIRRLRLEAAQRAPVRPCIEKFYVETPRTPASPLPLGALYVLREARPPHVPGFEKPNIVDAALVLRRCAYRPALVAHFDQRRLYFEAGARILGAAELLLFSRMLNFRTFEDDLARLEQHWRGLTERAA